MLFLCASDEHVPDHRFIIQRSRARRGASSIFTASILQSDCSETGVKHSLKRLALDTVLAAVPLDVLEVDIWQVTEALCKRHNSACGI